MIKLKDIIERFEQLVPKSIQWEKDNCGLQIGDIGQDISKVLICLEVTETVIKEAVNKKANLIFTHHPLIFYPLKQIKKSDRSGKIIYDLIKNDISVYSAHTNLDKYNHGISYSLAEALGLQNIKILIEEKDLLYKIVTFVPEAHVEKVTDALSNAGAGKIGEYDFCSFRTPGKGTFRGSERANPYIGVKGQKEYVDEIRLEMIFPEWKMSEVLNKLRSSHPYEEIAYDIYPLMNRSCEMGFGAIGELDKEIKKEVFLNNLKKILNIPFVRLNKTSMENIKKVAVLGGAGGSYCQYAIDKKTDAFVTSDISYHTFFDVQDNIVLVDAGHYETEIFGLNVLEYMLKDICNPGVQILRTENITNPIIYF